ncbi:hypothetical protein [Photobacterium rosenbergii]|uniref:Transcriptional regulator n=1 Tax=Photobacterium rosenbergii TaxID=294936 RepID=A0ABU3ZEP4_9GAMM|nr:hypothetical protein [Photobacterium rosenbergii]MDV5168577.1 hypothetical protein [Photobacterium rosenbergii]
MTEKQISLMFDKLWKVGTKAKFEAIRDVLLHGVRPSVAEREYGLPINTVARDSKRVKDGIEFCRKITEAGNGKS